MVDTAVMTTTAASALTASTWSTNRPDRWKTGTSCLADRAARSGRSARRACRVEGADDVRFRLVADMECVRGIDAERFEGGSVGPDVRLFVSNQRRGDDQVHLVGECQVGAELGDIVIGVGDDGAFHAGLAQPSGGGHDIGEDAIAAMGLSSTAGVSYSAI